MSNEQYFIKTQPDPQIPRGTFKVTNSGLAGAIVPGVSAYAISKLAAQRFVEYLHIGMCSLSGGVAREIILLLTILISSHLETRSFLCFFRNADSLLTHSSTSQSIPPSAHSLYYRASYKHP